MKVFQGAAGRWVSFEWLPPYFLAAIIIPLSFLWPEKPHSWADAAMHVLSAGDLMAIDVCLLLSVTVSMVRPKPGYSSGYPEDYKLVFQAVFLLMANAIFYGVQKTVPASMHPNEDLALIYSILTLGLSAWTCLVILIHKLRE